MGSLGVQNWMQYLVTCSAPSVSYKAWPAALVLSVSSSLPVYRAPVVLPVVQQYAWFAPTQTQLYGIYVRSDHFLFLITIYDLVRI